VLTQPCHICGEHHAGVCKFCPRCRIFHNALAGCKAKKDARSAGTFAHQVLAQKRGADEMENSGEPEEPQGKRVNFCSGAEQMAAAAAEQQAGEAEGEMLEGGVEGEMEEEGMGEDEDDDSWRERIDLRAVECCDHRVELSTPPFPFYQYWDSQYDTRKKRRDWRRSRAQMRASPDYTLGSHA